MSTELQVLERELYGTADQLEAELRVGRVRPSSSESAALDRQTTMAKWAGELRARGCAVNIRGTVHMVASIGHRKFDAWPGTGRWNERDNAIDRQRIAWNRPPRRSGTGLESLVAAVVKP